MPRRALRAPKHEASQISQVRLSWARRHPDEKRRRKVKALNSRVLSRVCFRSNFTFFKILVSLNLSPRHGAPGSISSSFLNFPFSAFLYSSISFSADHCDGFYLTVSQSLGDCILIALFSKTRWLALTAKLQRVALHRVRARETAQKKH